MKHCHISILCNELTFLKQKLPFLYNNFEQVIFIDYDILNKCNSNDGSIEYIENFNDIDNKITLVKFNENDLKTITNYNGTSMIEKRKMFAKGSQYIKNDIDIVWATDMDEFFDKNLLNVVENEFTKDKDLITLNVPHYIFIYNQYNIFKGDEINNTSYICPPRITRHFKNKIYGHCNFHEYGKTIRCENEFIYHFAWIGLKRIGFKLNIYYIKGKKDETKKRNNDTFLKQYQENLTQKKKYINISHPNKQVNINSIIFEGLIPNYIDAETLINELNEIN